MAGLLTSLVAQIGTQGDASPHQGQTEQGLQGQPGEIKQRLHAGAVQFHKGILRGREGETKETELERERAHRMPAYRESGIQPEDRGTFRRA